MRVTRFSTAVAVAVACAVYGGNAAAQSTVQPVPAYPDNYYAVQPGTDDNQASPSDVPVPMSSDDDTGDEQAGSAQKGNGKDNDCGLGSYCDGKSADCCEELVACELFPETCCGLKIGGHFQVGYFTEGANGDGDTLFNNYPNRVQMQQAWIYAEKVADTGGCGWDWGFRGDYVYGTDAPDTQAFGNQPDTWDFGWNNGGAYGSAIPQAYGEIAYNNLSVKVGHFYTIQGYEVVQATGNFFYSHAFTMYRNEPFTHTGALATYTGIDKLTLYGGWVQGWDTGFNDNGGSAFLGGFKYQLRDNLAFTYTTTAGDFGYDPPTGFGSDTDAYMQSIVVNWTINDKWEYVFVSDYNDNDVLLAGPGDSIDKAWSAVNYLFYTINDCWRAGVRYEYFDDERLGAGSGNAPGYVNAYTAGLNWTPHTNLRVRPEYRFTDAQNSDPTYRDSSMFAVDAIITF